MTKRQQQHFTNLLNAMRYADAIAFCRALVATDPDAYRSLALAYDQAAAAARTEGHAYRRLASLAEKAIAKALATEMSPSNIHVRGIIALHAGRNVQALEDFLLAYKMEPKSGYAVSVANALRRLDRRQEALAVYRKAERRGDLNAIMLAYNIAQTLLELGRRDAATRKARQGLLVQPKNAFERVMQEKLQEVLSGSH